MVGSHGEATSDVTPSVSSDSVSLPTQLENLPVSRTAPNEEKKPKSSAEEEEGRTDGVREQEAKKEGLKEEVVQDLRVFELNSDSGKSTPSTNGKKGEVGQVINWAERIKSTGQSSER